MLNKNIINIFNWILRILTVILKDNQSINQTLKIKVKLQEGLPFKNLKSKNNPPIKCYKLCNIRL